MERARAVGKKRQHIIPKCYQKFWCDPATPAGQTPYIWIFSKDGRQKRRRAPNKAFVSTDVYTVRLPGKGRDLIIEDTLRRIEGTFVDLIRRKLVKRHPLEPEDKANLCVFAAAMFARVGAQSRIYTNFLQEVHEQAKRLEEMHNAEPRTSREISSMLENAQPQYVAMSLEMLAAVYYGMRIAVLLAPATDYFITSDSPTVWYNPAAYKWPPFFRSPGLAQGEIEVTMPLTPHHALFLSHNDRITGYLQLPSRIVRELNRRTRFHCDQWFISRHGEILQEWFEAGIPPEDRWENSVEGKRDAAAEDKTP